MNIGIFVLILLFMAATYVLPLTISFMVAILFLIEVGISGYFLVGQNVIGLVLILSMIMVVIDILLWNLVRST